MLLKRSRERLCFDDGHQEATVHRSVEGVRAYKRTSSAMKRTMSAILSQLDLSLGTIMKGRIQRKRLTAKIQGIIWSSMRLQTKRRSLVQCT